METSPPPLPLIDLNTHLYSQLTYTLTGLLPPPLDATPQALRARNHAAIAKVAALLPVNANEIDLAAQCIAARAQAEDVLRLLRQHAGDIGLVMRLNAQYSSMVRTSLSVHNRLIRVQSIRQKREAIESAANQDVWTQHIVERSMLTIIDPNAGPQQTTHPEAVPPTVPAATTPAPVTPSDDQSISPDGTESQDAAFETWMSAQFRSRLVGQLDTNLLHQVVLDAMAGSRVAGQGSSANHLRAS